MPFGWTDEPLVAEQKIVNLFHTVENTLNTLQKAYQVGNRLKHSTLDCFEFNWTHGYRAVMKWSGDVPNLSPNRGWYANPSIGYWMVYAERVGSLGDDRHKWPVWDTHQARYDPLPKGLLTRELPYDYLGRLNASRISEDLLIVATIEKNKWRPGPHNVIPDLPGVFSKKVDMRLPGNWLGTWTIEKEALNDVAVEPPKKKRGRPRKVIEAPPTTEYDGDMPRKWDEDRKCYI